MTGGGAALVDEVSEATKELRANTKQGQRHSDVLEQVPEPAVNPDTQNHGPQALRRTRPGPRVPHGSQAQFSKVSRGLEQVPDPRNPCKRSLGCHQELGEGAKVPPERPVPATKGRKPDTPEGVQEVGPEPGSEVSMGEVRLAGDG